MSTTASRTKRKDVELLRERIRRQATSSLLKFILYVKPDYLPAWHHREICRQIDSFLASPEKTRLMMFMPPQHGKSEIASRSLPAYILGRWPDTKIAACSYSIDLARMFNRDVQRYMSSPEYGHIFPETLLNSKNVVTDARGNWLRNSEEFEVVGRKGGYKAVGVMGGLSGRTVDFAIIDDPVKDALEAHSETYRNRVWEWYLNVLQTRLHNKSKVILIMTRWHEDDLAGRLLERQPGQWDVIRIQAIREGESIASDPRQIGEPLWPEKHSLEKILSLRALSERTFSSLYQQNPTVDEGDKIKRAWFQYCHEKELPGGLSWDMWIDGAYTKSTANDPTGLMVCAFHAPTNNLYVRHAHDAYMELPGLLNFLPDYAEMHGITARSRAFIEPKASGKSLSQMLNAMPGLGWSAVEIKSPLVQEGKESRIQVASPKVEAGKVWLVYGNWNERFVGQLAGFPNAAHDEYVDLLGYAVWHYYRKAQGVRRVN